MNEKSQVIKIMLEYLQGPIWLTDVETGEIFTGIKIVDTDPFIRETNCKCAELYNSYYEFDSHGQACWFNYEKEKEEKEIMLELITKLKKRLNELNDGSFIIEDYETERLKKL